MITKWWEVETPSRSKLNICDIESCAVVWADVVDDTNYCQAMFPCKKTVDVDSIFGQRLVGVYQRFPNSKYANATYHYVLVENSQAELINLVSNLLRADKLLTIKSGPAVLDAPILGMRDLQRTLPGLHYFRSYGVNRKQTVAACDMFRMYEAGVLQHGLFPLDLQQKLIWYKTLLDEEYRAYARASDQLVAM